ncbi:MAG TPA: hypothetical protein VMB75_07400, partial [Rhodocyclaceae bacterium]|nr:hypothetical protein [Rhodocyclaceae bacterium]
PPPSREEVARYVPSEEGVNDFLDLYWGYAPNKAFAISPDGSYGLSGELMSSTDHAAATALRYCERGRAQMQLISPCRVVNINGKWVP